MIRRWIGQLEAVTKALGAAIALVAAVAFVVPLVGTWVNLLTAARFGAVGHVYYEVKENDQLTTQGQLYLLRSGGARFSDLGIGDKLQAASEVNFRLGSTSDSRTVFVLQPRDCVIVLAKAREVAVQAPLSGGWLRVATTACGLFS